MVELKDILELAQLPATVFIGILLWNFIQKYEKLVDRVLDRQEKLDDRVSHVERAQGIWPPDEKK